MTLPVFKPGDRVTQRYQTGGSQRSRECEVVCVVQQGEFPSVALRSAGIAGEVAMYKPPRDRISYVVRVGSKLYWPRVAGLRAVDGGVVTACTCGQRDMEAHSPWCPLRIGEAISRAGRNWRGNDDHVYLLFDAAALAAEVDRLRGLLAGGSR